MPEGPSGLDRVNRGAKMCQVYFLVTREPVVAGSQKAVLTFRVMHVSRTEISGYSAGKLIVEVLSAIVEGPSQQSILLVILKIRTIQMLN